MNTDERKKEYTKIKNAYKGGVIMTKQQRIARHIAFRFLRDMKHLKQTGIAHNVIIELWLSELITFNTKNILIKWLYM